MQRRTFTLGAVSTALGVCAPAIVRANLADLELDLLLDYSSSMFKESQNHVLQKWGHYYALKDYNVRRVLLDRRPLVSVYTWSNEPVLVCERRVRTVNDIDLLAEQLLERVPEQETSQGTGHIQVLRFFNRKQPARAGKRVIDLATDEAPFMMSEEACLSESNRLYRAKTTLNALLIGATERNRQKLDQFVTTPDGFVQPVYGPHDVISSTARKLVREVEMVS